MVLCKRRMNAGIGGSHKIVITRNIKRFDKNAFLGDICSIKWDQVANKTDNINVTLITLMYRIKYRLCL